MGRWLINAENVRVGDTIHWLGDQGVIKVNSIDEYTGVHEFIFGVARDSSGRGISLCHGDRLTVDR